MRSEDYSSIAEEATELVWWWMNLMVLVEGKKKNAGLCFHKILTLDYLHT